MGIRSRPPRRGRRHLSAVLLVILLTGVAACRIEPVPINEPGPFTAGPWLWQWQATGPLDTDAAAAVFLLDPVTTTSTETGLLRARDRRLICQVSAGTYSSADPDADRFPASVRGRGTGDDGARWVDVRQWEILEPIIADRLRLCRGKRFHAAALTGLDGYAHRSGFRLTYDDQIRFNRRVAELTRSVGLSPGMVDNLDQVAALAPDFDFAVTQECVRLRRCVKLLPFTEAGKPVLHVEYDRAPTDFCVTGLGYGFSSMRKNRSLDAWRDPCPIA